MLCSTSTSVGLPTLFLVGAHWLVCLVAYLLLVAIMAWNLSDSPLAFLVLPAVLFAWNLAQGIVTSTILVVIAESFPLPM